jgi:hypothetical protein
MEPFSQSFPQQMLLTQFGTVGVTAYYSAIKDVLDGRTATVIVANGEEF